jgi:hypothetical protein
MPYVRQPADLSQPVRYAYGPDSERQPGVPRGSVIEHELVDSWMYLDRTARSVPSWCSTT